MSADEHEAALGVPCPTCGQREGSPCKRYKHGAWTPKDIRPRPHTSRLASAARALFEIKPDTLVNSIAWSPRVYNRITNAFGLAELKSLDLATIAKKSRRDWMRMKHFGKTSWDELQSVFQRAGISLDPAEITGPDSHRCEGGYLLVRYAEHWTLNFPTREFGPLQQLHSGIAFCPTCGKRLPLEA